MRFTTKTNIAFLMATSFLILTPLANANTSDQPTKNLNIVVQDARASKLVTISGMKSASGPSTVTVNNIDSKLEFYIVQAYAKSAFRSDVSKVSVTISDVSMGWSAPYFGEAGFVCKISAKTVANAVSSSTDSSYAEIYDADPKLEQFNKKFVFSTFMENCLKEQATEVIIAIEKSIIENNKKVEKE